MTRVNKDIDDDAVARPMDADRARAMRGSGWDGNLDDMSSVYDLLAEGRAPDSLR